MRATVTVRLGGGVGYSTWNLTKVKEPVFGEHGVRVAYDSDGDKQAEGETFLPYPSLVVIAWTKGE